jgi:hypothetical protein
MMSYKHNNACRICGETSLLKFLDLGKQPLANGFLTKVQFKDEQKFPLKVYFCKNCGLVQLLDVVSPKFLFEDYAYYTARSSKALPQHFKDFAETISREYSLKPDDLVIDIGGNDGTFLKNLDCKVLNVEPSLPHCRVSERNKVLAFCGYFTSQTAMSIRNLYGKAKIITASNVFAHIDNLYDAMAGVRMLLEDDGVFIVEVHHFLSMFKNFDFDQIYHEHLSYFTINPLMLIGHKFGLCAFRVDKIPIHGGSLRIYFKEKNFPLGSSPWDIASEEFFAYANDLNALMQWSKNVENVKKGLTTLVYDLHDKGKKIAGYGAPAKGNTLLNYCKLGPEVIDYITDATPAKQGKFSPGMHIPIVSKERFHSDPPDYALLLAWNYKDEILREEEDFIKTGGKFIVPIPEPKVIP